LAGKSGSPSGGRRVARREMNFWEEDGDYIGRPLTEAGTLGRPPRLILTEAGGLQAPASVNNFNIFYENINRGGRITGARLG
jgi:hypothetical protein